MSPAPRTPPGFVPVNTADEISALTHIAATEDLGRTIAALARRRTGASEAELWVSVDDDRVRSVDAPLLVRTREELGFQDLPCEGDAAHAPGAWRGKQAYCALPLRCGESLVGVLALAWATLVPDSEALSRRLESELALWALALDRAKARADAARADATSIARVGAGLAHTLSNVVQAAMSSVESARAAQAVALQRAALDEARQVLRRASVLVQQLAVLGGRAESPMPSEMRGLVAGLVAALRRQMPRELRLEFESGADECWVLIDRGTMEATLAGLVYATREALGSVGTIRVTTRLVTSSGSSHGAGAGGPAPRTVVIEVQRVTTGADPRRPSTLTPVSSNNNWGDTSGAGHLGLTFARAAVVRYGGDVLERPLRNGGSAIEIVLPEAQRETRQRGSGSRPAVARAKLSILVADDEPAVLRSVVRVLKSAGHEVLAAPDGTDALSLARITPELHVALLDLTMPGLAGPPLVAALRKELPSLPVVIMTGYASDEMVEALRREGVAAVLRKPVAMQALLAAIDHAVVSTSSFPPG